MSIVKFLNLAVLLFFAIACSFGQRMNQGTLKFEVTNIKTDSPEMQQMIASMQGSSQIIEFEGQRQKMTMDMMGGLMKMTSIWNSASGGTETYMDMMGQKIKTVITAEDMKKIREESAAVMKEHPIVYDKNVKKTILGKECYKATYEAETDGQKFSMILFITDDIKVPTSFVQNLNQMEISGTPLEWIMDAGMMQMTFSATEISDKVSADFHNNPVGEYKEMTMEQLRQMGMGGQFGF